MSRILFAILLLLPVACTMPAVYESDRAAITGRTWIVTGASSGRSGGPKSNALTRAKRSSQAEKVIGC